MKKRSGKNLIRFFYHLLVVLVMAMPMLSGLVRVIYVQSNMNAKDSYYGETINKSYSNAVKVGDLDTNITYTWNHSQSSFTNFSYTDKFYYLDKFIVGDTEYNYLGMRILFYQNGNISFLAYNTFGGSYVAEYYSSNYDNIVFRFISIVPYSGSNEFNDFEIAFYVTYNDYSYLDNAFDYSIWKTMQDFTFHSDFSFTDIANGIFMTFDNTNLYIQYINFYINWVLTCAVFSFAPYVLLTFYHLAIGLLDKFTRKGENL